MPKSEPRNVCISTVWRKTEATLLRQNMDGSGARSVSEYLRAAGLGRPGIGISRHDLQETLGRGGAAVRPLRGGGTGQGAESRTRRGPGLLRTGCGGLAEPAQRRLRGGLSSPAGSSPRAARADGLRPRRANAEGGSGSYTLKPAADRRLRRQSRRGGNRIHWDRGQSRGNARAAPATV